MSVRSIERYFLFDYEKGLLKMHLSSADHHKVKINVHKQTTVPEEKQQTLLAYRDLQNTYNREIDMSYVRSVIFDEIMMLQDEAEEQIRLAQYDTSGVKICTSIREYVPEEGFEKYKCPNYCEISQINGYPFNYGVVIRRAGDTQGRLRFVCLANDGCRNKNVCLELNPQVAPNRNSMSRIAPPRIKTNEEIVEDHLRERHWNLVLQYI